ncbi:hypothetical protein RD792_011846 [Penstemon davidsonii]|uniref:Uncharacterized protein n=1 Tax=Penstemon davidsonii TaxID=160366 RepID=A0ABR0CWV8_9LAMI|nr:hypothetical protein RD792_011846 [Penstemon davidsonii]
MSRVVPALQPSNQIIHEIFFFFAIYLISVGTGGHKPSLESFGADQFDDDHPKERKYKMSFFNWWNFGLCCGLLFGVTIIAVLRFRKPIGSPLTPMLQVIVAAIAKRKLPYPSDPEQLYEVPKSEKTQGRLLFHTEKLKY